MIPCIKASLEVLYSRGYIGPLAYDFRALINICFGQSSHFETDFQT